MGDVRFHYITGLALFLIMVVGPVRAQELGGREAGGTAYYTFARPGQNTIEVLVLGGGQSGIYEVGEDINMGQLMALAGGGGRGGRRTKVKVYLYRLQGGKRRKILEEKIGQFTARAQYPSLQDGDVLRIENRERLNWRDWLQVSTSLLSLTFTILTLFDVNVR